MADKPLKEEFILRALTMSFIPIWYIHQEGVVHRDIKPDNILQKYIGDKDYYMLTDFGASQQSNTSFITTGKDWASKVFAPIE